MRRHLTRDQAADAATRGELVTITDAAEALEAPARTVRSWVDRGHLPFIRVDGAMRVDLAQAATLEAELRTLGPARHARRIAQKA